MLTTRQFFQSPFLSLALAAFFNVLKSDTKIQTRYNYASIAIPYLNTLADAYSSYSFLLSQDGILKRKRLEQQELEFHQYFKMNLSSCIRTIFTFPFCYLMTSIVYSYPHFTLTCAS